MSSSASTVVTPQGRSFDEWTDLIASARSVDLSDLADVREWSGRAPELVVVAAHPDDETIGAGRLLAAWSRRGWPSTAIVATSGEACLDHVAARPSDLVERRLAEWDAALDLLGIGTQDGRRLRLALPDGRLADHRDALSTAVTEVVADLTAGGSPVVIVAPHPADPHPDHQAVGHVSRAAARDAGWAFVGFGVWLTYWADPLTASLPVVWRLKAEPGDDRARTAALACFRTQFEPLAPDLDPVVPQALLDHHREQLLFPDLAVPG